MTHVAIFLLSLAGFASLLLAMPRHQADWLRRSLAPTIARAMRLTGLTLLGLALLVAGQGLTWAYGAVAWFGWMTSAAALIVAANTGRQTIVRPMGRKKP